MGMSARTSVSTSESKAPWRLLRALRVYRARVFGVGVILRSMFQHSSEVGGIEVRGPRSFCDSVSAALRALGSAAPAAMDLCQRHINLVVRSRHSGVDATSRPAIVMLGDWVATVSTAYLASGLAHEAHHCSLYWAYRDAEPARDVPSEIFTGERAERECVEYQIAVLKQLGETGEIVDQLRESLKTEWWNVRWHDRTW